MAEIEKVKFEVAVGGDDVHISILKGQLQEGTFRFRLHDATENFVEELPAATGAESEIGRALGHSGNTLKGSSLRIYGMLVAPRPEDGQNYSVTLTVTQGDKTVSAVQTGTFDQAKTILFLIEFE